MTMNDEELAGRWWDCLSLADKVSHGESAAGSYEGDKAGSINTFSKDDWWDVPFLSLNSQNKVAIGTYFMHLLDKKCDAVDIKKDAPVEKDTTVELPCEANLRDLFAMHTMKCILMRDCAYNSNNTEDLARIAYQLAEYMMRARTKTMEELDPVPAGGK